MSSILEVFQDTRRQGRAALISYLLIGLPNVESTLSLVCAADEAGTDIFELGIPFTDALIDGPLLQAAGRVSLRNGVTVRRGLEVVAELRRRGMKKPILMMSSLNPLLAYGMETISDDANRAGVNGFIIPDLPVEAIPAWGETVRKAGLVNVSFLAPTTTAARMRMIVSRAEGFLYCMATTGLTGPRKDVAPALQQFLAQVRTVTHLPLAVGFGISSPEQVRQVSQWADGVVVGSALIDTIVNSDADQVCRNLSDAVRRMADATWRPVARPNPDSKAAGEPPRRLIAHGDSRTQ